ncbi:hypothetical protein Bbelb_291630 [Branchiostoma belcheri]|nr:hypothetical protein Bbelb_291630 [Branchiostoma belcheri]
MLMRQTTDYLEQNTPTLYNIIANLTSPQYDRETELMGWRLLEQERSPPYKCSSGPHDPAPVRTVQLRSARSQLRSGRSQLRGQSSTPDWWQDGRYGVISKSSGSWAVKLDDFAVERTGAGPYGPELRPSGPELGPCGPELHLYGEPHDTDNTQLLSIVTDARHAQRRNSHRSDIMALGQSFAHVDELSQNKSTATLGEVKLLCSCGLEMYRPKESTTRISVDKSPEYREDCGPAPISGSTVRMAVLTPTHIVTYCTSLQTPTHIVTYCTPSQNHVAIGTVLSTLQSIIDCQFNHNTVLNGYLHY